MKSKVILRNSATYTQADPPVDELNDLIGRSRRVLVASHIDPDGDALGTQLAVAGYLKSLGKEVQLIRDAEIPFKYRFLPGVEEIPHFSSVTEDVSFDTAVILECPNTGRIGHGQRYLTDDMVIINIDHHRDNSLEGTVNWINVDASSVAEMVYEFFERVDYRIDRNTAELLYTAILTDTGRFRFGSTSARTMHIAGDLIAAGADPQYICDNVYFNMRPQAMKLIGRVLNSMEFFHNDKICLLTLTKEMLKETGASDSDSDGLVDYTLYSERVRIGAILKEMDDTKTKLSVRSRNEINVSELCSKYGGGGHFNAAGCFITLGLEEAKKEVVRVFGMVVDD